jgi:hypothetical protein
VGGAFFGRPQRIAPKDCETCCVCFGFYLYLAILLIELMIFSCSELRALLEHAARF